MSHFVRIHLRNHMLLALAGGAFLMAGCASKPKDVAVLATKPNTDSEATAPNRATGGSNTNGTSQLPPIAPAQEFSDGSQAGLTSQQMAESAGGGSQMVAANLAEAGNRVYFLTDRYDLTEEARATLARQAAWAKANAAKRIIVAGNADERGTREYNLALGSRRAASVRDYLVGLGVEASMIETVSYGKERPVDPRSNEDGWAINRNAATQLVE